MRTIPFRSAPTACAVGFSIAPARGGDARMGSRKSFVRGANPLEESLGLLGAGVKTGRFRSA